MLLPSLAVLWLSGLGLAPADSVPGPPPAESPGRPAPPAPLPPVAAGVAVAVVTAWRRRGAPPPDGAAGIAEGASPGDALGLDSSLVVFVPGHGDPPAEDVFDDLVGMMDLDPGSVRYFDYRWVSGDLDHRVAASEVPIDDAAAALNAFIAGLATEDRPIYLVGFSKGGATVAHLVADWDEGEFGPADAVQGAALLDPPMAAGFHGWLQSVGRMWGPVPDDGGYDPERCVLFSAGCRDTRDGLGEASDVDVIVVRNPKAGVTSFTDRPRDLRVFEAPDDGPSAMGQLISNPFDLPGRISEAHKSVLSDPKVARCLGAEIVEPGTCGLEEMSGPSASPVRPPGANWLR